jgi:hypothetical protein
LGETKKAKTMNKLLDVSEKQKAALPATRYENPWLEAASEASNDFGRLLKFVKGKFECGDDEISLGTEFVAHVDQIARGWVRFEEGKVVDRIIGKIADGFRPPQREELPDNDPRSWTEKDTRGEPRDPWVAQWFLPLIAVATGDVTTFVTGSKGGVAAVSNLCRVYGRKHRDGLLPIVALRIRSYKHKQYGRIETPDLPVVGWEGAPTVMPIQAAADDLNDAIPF